VVRSGETRAAVESLSASWVALKSDNG